MIPGLSPSQNACHTTENEILFPESSFCNTDRFHAPQSSISWQEYFPHLPHNIPETKAWLPLFHINVPAAPPQLLKGSCAALGLTGLAGGAALAGCCAQSDNGHCILLDDGEECVCPQLISYSLLCKWFQTAVLPLDKLLYAELFKTEDKKRCTECGTSFASTSNSVKYCPDCRKRITRRQAAERMRKRRALVT